MASTSYTDLQQQQLTLTMTSNNSLSAIPQVTPNDVSQDVGNEYLYILPSIIIFGVVGNIISLVTILHSRLRKTAANQYLIVLTAADSVFLLALMMIWAKFDYLEYKFCVLIEYVLQTSSYVSSWSISVLTIERYLAIVHPLKHMRVSLSFDTLYIDEIQFSVRPCKSFHTHGFLGSDSIHS